MSSEPSPGTDDVRVLFDANARTYDRVNSIISLGLDARWRDWVARRAIAETAAPGRPARVLDAFAGTGLVGIRAAQLGAEVTLADFSPRMLAVAREHAASRGVRVHCVAEDLTGDPATWGSELDGPFDTVTMVFGVRYLDDPSAVIAGLATRLGERGRIVVMDFVDPQHGLLSRLAAVYFFHVLPRVASALAGHGELYDRLTATTHAIRGREELERVVGDAGLTVAETRVMGFGLVVGIVAHSEQPAPKP